jgi:antitoxin component of MazEF toxin-antitoxin module
MKTSFTTTILAHGNNTGIEVPAAHMAALGLKKNPPVVVYLPGYSYRSTVAVMNGAFMIPLSAAHRQAAGVAAGMQVEVTLELDLAPRSVELPADLAAALAAAPGSQAAFDALAPSKRKELVRQVEEAKASETRTRRIAKIVTDLG